MQFNKFLIFSCTFKLKFLKIHYEDYEIGKHSVYSINQYFILIFKVKHKSIFLFFFTIKCMIFIIY